MCNGDLSDFKAATWFFNGEGCTYVAKQKSTNGNINYSVCISIGGIHKPNIDWWESIFPGGDHYVERNRANWLYRYRVRKVDRVKTIIEEMWDWLSQEKRMQAWNCFEKYQLNPNQKLELNVNYPGQF